jgi:DNA invertase Pin-like site-specific DNA recombinase
MNSPNEAPSLVAAVGYARTSSIAQRDNTSIKDQIMRIQAHADARNLLLHAIMYDDGVSGASLTRPALWDAIQMLKCTLCQPRKMPEYVSHDDWNQSCACGQMQGLSTIIVWDFKRFGRTSSETIFLCLEVLDKLDKRLVIVDGDIQIDTSTPMGRFMLKLFANMAELDKEELHDKWNRGKAFVKLNTVKFAEGGVPYGFQSDRECKSGSNLIPKVDPHDAAKGEFGVLKYIYLLKAAGLSNREISQRLNKEGIKARKGGHWHENQVWRILADTGRKYPQVVAYHAAIR